MEIRGRNISVENSGDNYGVEAGVINGDVQVSVFNQRKFKFPSLIPSLIEQLAELANISDEDMDKQYKISSEDLQEYRIEDKIEYNRVIKYKEIIDDYSQYGAICENAFNIIDDNDTGMKRKILKNINSMYKKEKGQVLLDNRGKDSIDIIRENSDAIIENVINSMTEKINNDDNGKNILIEDIEEGLSRIICYAFIECKILEKPRW